MNRIQTLDGLRGVAILMVVAGHALTHSTALSADTRGWLVSFANAGMGVRLFFALSGYLITELLLREIEVRGSVNLPAFYQRRALRILPAFYVFLGALALGSLFMQGTLHLPWTAWLAAGTFTWNYSFLFTNHGGADLWNLGHTWSLAVEAQFYLLWPLLLIRFGPRRALAGALILLALAPLIRAGSYQFFPGQRGYLGMMLHTGFDGILAGCAAALLARRPRAMEFLRRHCAMGLGLSFLWIAVLGPILIHEVRGFSILAGFSLDALAAAWLVAALHRCPPVWTQRLLGAGVIPAIGVISYSLYLWQQVFLGPRDHLGANPMWLSVATAFAVACGSYWMVERPFLRKRRHPAATARPLSSQTPA
jgi:peptidoglycan/LPS O-acetylase OafA/YrhL